MVRNLLKEVQANLPSCPIIRRTLLNQRRGPVKPTTLGELNMDPQLAMTDGWSHRISIPHLRWQMVEHIEYEWCHENFGERRAVRFICGDYQPRTANPHNHDVDLVGAEIAKVWQEMKARASTTNDTPRTDKQGYGITVRNLPREVSMADLPSCPIIRRTLLIQSRGPVKPATVAKARLGMKARVSITTDMPKQINTDTFRNLLREVQANLPSCPIIRRTLLNQRRGPVKPTTLGELNIWILMDGRIHRMKGAIKVLDLFVKNDPPILELGSQVLRKTNERRQHERWAVRFICGAYTSRNPGSITKMRENLNLPTLASRRQTLKLKSFFKVVEGLVPALSIDNFMTKARPKQNIKPKKLTFQYR